MQQTSNYALNKPEQTDTVNIENLNSNFDTLDAELKKVSDKANLIQTAGGTGTAITLTNITLTNGFTVTFVVSANNSGAATTINTKPFYKPGGTTAPNLIAGKAVTVWYSTSGGCFFIKASAEGDAVAADVLAGKKFSNDNDTGIIGTMANNGAVTLTPGTADQPIAVGYHNGNGKVLGDTKLVTGNIKAGASIFGVAGKASIVDTADATAVAGEILIGDSAYVNGSKINGSMPNNGAVNQSLAINGTYTIPTGYHNGSGKVTQALTTKTAATITPGTTDQTITAGQYLSGTQTIKGDANLVSANIVKGKTIFNVAGTFDNRLINFPLSIQVAEPTPIKVGHLWIKSTRGDAVNSISFVNSINAGIPDNSLILEVFDTRSAEFNINQQLDILAPAKSVNLTYSANITANHPWKVGDNSIATLFLNNPRTYIKTSGNLYLETAYLWDGTTWQMLCQTDTYMFLGVQDYGGDSSYDYNYSCNPIYTYNRTGESTFIEHSNFTTKGYNKTAHTINISESTGEYILVRPPSLGSPLIIYRRVGDVFTQYTSLTGAQLTELLPSPYNSSTYLVSYLNYYNPRSNNSWGTKITSDGKYLMVSCAWINQTSSTSLGTGTVGIAIFKNNGDGTFSFTNLISLYSGTTYGSANFSTNCRVNFSTSLDYGVIAVDYSWYNYNSSGSTSYNRTAVLFGSPAEGYTATQVVNMVDSSYGTAISQDGSFCVFTDADYAQYNSSNSFRIKVYAINRVTKGVSVAGTLWSRSYYSCFSPPIITPDNYIYLPRHSNSSAGESLYLTMAKYVNGVYTQLGDYAVNIGGQTIYDSAGNGTPYTYVCTAIAIDPKNNLMFLALCYGGVRVCSITRDSTGKITALTQVTQINEPSDMSGYIDYGPIILTPQSM